MSGRRNFKTEAVLDEVFNERVNQDMKWGQQDHANGTGLDTLDGPTGGFAELAKEAKLRCDTAAKFGTLTWEHILTEEYLEALAESDPKRLRAELIQVAAVAVSWIEAIDRKQNS